ncbi:MAG: ATP-grasp domain-containing protein [Treponema sp.]|nr:ATP-grasp domain-containing protein [Treponema sp.]
MKETIIILGAGVMQGPAIRIAKELGYYAIALDGSSSAPYIHMADRFEQIDLKDKEAIETFARSLQSECVHLGIMTAGTDFSASVAWTAEKLGLPGIPYEAALNASDKSRMRECFKKNGLPSPDFFTITEDILRSIPQNEISPLARLSHSLLPAPRSLSFPLVIKPVDNMGSRGCRRVDSIEEFYKAAEVAIGFSRSGRVIVEAYMEGPEFSVDAIVYHGEITICGLADRHIFFPPYFIEMGHTMPTQINTDKQEAILDTFRAGVRALGLAGKENIGAAKGDIKLTENGPMIGEIAARLSGGYMSGWTYPYSSGVQPVRAAILAAMGRKPDCLIPEKTETCAERAFISIPGTVKAITGAEQAKNLLYVNDFFLRITEGGKVSFPENNVTKCGNIIASAPDRETAIKAAETAARSILIKLDPADQQTANFLSICNLNKKSTDIETQSKITNSPETNKQVYSQDFPPDAFQLTDELIETLNQLPDPPLPTPYSPFPTPHSPLPTAIITPFPTFTSSGLTDYMGRTVEEAIEAVRLLTGLPLPVSETICNSHEFAENKIILGRSFWVAFIRGSYQGAIYYIENLGVK